MLREGHLSLDASARVGGLRDVQVHCMSRIMAAALLV